MQYKRCCALQFSGELAQALPAVQVGCQVAAGQPVGRGCLLLFPNAVAMQTRGAAGGRCAFITISTNRPMAYFPLTQAALDCLGKRRAALLVRIAAPAEGDDAEKLRAGAPQAGWCSSAGTVVHHAALGSGHAAWCAWQVGILVGPAPVLHIKCHPPKLCLSAESEEVAALQDDLKEKVAELEVGGWAVDRWVMGGPCQLLRAPHHLVSCTWCPLQSVRLASAHACPCLYLCWRRTSSSRM